MQIEVVDAELRDVSVAELTRRWRERVGEIIGAEEVTFTSSLISKAAPIEIELNGADLRSLRAAANLVIEQLTAYPGVLDIRDSARSGKRELVLELLPSAETLGLSVHDLGLQVRQAFYGQDVQRLQRGRDEVKVVVRYPLDERRSLVDLENMRIRTADGSAVPFSSVQYVVQMGRRNSGCQNPENIPNSKSRVFGLLWYSKNRGKTTSHNGHYAKSASSTTSALLVADV